MRGRNRQASLETRRIPFDGEVTLEVGGGRRIVGRTLDLSPGGFFVPCDDPGPIGLTASFTVQVAPGWRPIAGHGRVAWIRPGEEGAGRPAGMAVAFTDIEERDHRLLRWVVAHHLRTGAPPEGPEPRLGSPGERLPENSPHTADSTFPGFISASPPGEASAEPERRALRWWLAAAGLLVFLTGLAGACLR